MPTEVFWTHVLPRCDIETRLGFKRRAPRVALPPMKPQFEADMKECLRWRRDGPMTLPRHRDGYNYTIPYWKHGTQRVGIGAPAENAFTIKPLVYLRVWNTWRGYSMQGYVTVPWTTPKDSILVSVEKVDARYNKNESIDYDNYPIKTPVAKIFIEPLNPPPISTTRYRNTSPSKWDIPYKVYRLPVQTTLDRGL